jgi:predicted GNAT family acetyltransferase
MLVPELPALTEPRPRINRHRDAATFLAASATFREQEPVLTNVIGSVAAGVVEGRHYERELWLTVHGDDGRTVGVAMRTAPWNLVVSPMDDVSARALGAFMAAQDPGLPGITGPRRVVDGVLEGLASSRLPRAMMADIARVLDDFTPPEPVEGAARRATADEQAVIVDWHRRFAEEVGLPAHFVEESVAAGVAAGSFWLWTVAGTDVALAGHALPVETPSGHVARLGPVFTPPPFRGRGFGTAITAHVAASLRDAGCTVMLFADAANARTNGIYQRLGFEARAEIVEVELIDVGRHD